MTVGAIRKLNTVWLDPHPPGSSGYLPLEVTGDTITTEVTGVILVSYRLLVTDT